MIPKSMMHEIRETLLENFMDFRVTIPDVQAIIFDQFMSMSGRIKPSSLADFDYAIYHAYEEVGILVLKSVNMDFSFVRMFLEPFNTQKMFLVRSFLSSIHGIPRD